MRTPKKLSAGEEAYALHLRAHKLPKPVREFVFDDKRKWKFDFAWPRLFLAAEIEGGTFSGGRHTRGVGFAKDAEKYNAAVLQGWRVLRFTTQHVKSGYAIDITRAAMP